MLLVLFALVLSTAANDATHFHFHLDKGMDLGALFGPQSPLLSGSGGVMEGRLDGVGDIFDNVMMVRELLQRIPTRRYRAPQTATSSSGVRVGSNTPRFRRWRRSPVPATAAPTTAMVAAAAAPAAPAAHKLSQMTAVRFLGDQYLPASVRPEFDALVTNWQKTGAWPNPQTMSPELRKAIVVAMLPLLLPLLPPPYNMLLAGALNHRKA